MTNVPHDSRARRQQLEQCLREHGLDEESIRAAMLAEVANAHPREAARAPLRSEDLARPRRAHLPTDDPPRRRLRPKPGR